MEKLFARIHPVWLPLLAVALLAGMYFGDQWTVKQIVSEKEVLKQLAKSAEQATFGKDHFSTLLALRESDLEAFKESFSGHALSQKSLYEAGLSAQEERRLLDKQWEIMVTYLFINPALQRVFLMRAEQPLQSYLISYIPLRAFGGAPEKLPSSIRIVSKERFAHPERGRSEEVGGKLVYTPPQVGTSVRSNALGEYVIFTNSKMILHGPPVDPEKHEQFPHICLGLDLDAARKLYRGTFIGTKIVLRGGVAVRRDPDSTFATPSAPANSTTTAEAAPLPVQ
jgi:hypothetical protein